VRFPSGSLSKGAPPPYAPMVPRVVLGPLASFPDARGVPVSIGGVRIALFRVGERVFAVDDSCPHRGFPLNDGPVDGTTVRCRTHGSCFDLRSGELLRGPSARGVRAYAATIVDGQVAVEI
jgi:nitrite reductase/ring-hydroxylating ferredoxin subunit